ncbi:MAG: hypothetical protein PHI76_01200 [Clostridia bacterium]|nr:hypothetical protein [Clostridia bacterium]
MQKESDIKLNNINEAGREKVKIPDKEVSQYQTKSTVTGENTAGNNREQEKKPQEEKEKKQPYEDVLLGNFDSNNNYEIPEMVAAELLNIEKIVIGKENNDYKAYALCGEIRLEFYISVEDIIIPDSMPEKRAVLKLIEKYRTDKAQTQKDTIITTVSHYQDIFTNDFLFKVRKEFHLNSKDEVPGRVFHNNENIAPFIVGSFKNRFSQIEIVGMDKVKSMAQHIKELISILRSSEKGRNVANKFLKKTKFDKNQIDKTYTYKELLKELYSAIDIAISEKNLDTETIKKITEARKAFAKEVKLEGAGAKSKAGSSGSAKKSGKKSSSSSRSSGSKGKSGGGGKGGGGEGDAGKKKDDKSLFDIMDLLIENLKTEKIPTKPVFTPQAKPVIQPAKPKPVPQAQSQPKEPLGDLLNDYETGDMYRAALFKSKLVLSENAIKKDTNFTRSGPERSL